MTLAASIVVPTTGDRGPLLPHSVGSALRQTVPDIEVLIIGDGVDPATRAIALSLCEDDERVRFFDFPKHERRGEPNRHQVLTTEARGEIVCYLTDRDLYFPDHVAEMRRLLATADLAHTLFTRVEHDEQLVISWPYDLTMPTVRARYREAWTSMALSLVAHTMDAYRRLPEGWRTTPTDVWTDHHMWQQFLAEPWVTVATSRLPTVLYFNRGAHPGWSTEQRLDLLERWGPRLETPQGVEQLRREFVEVLWQNWVTREQPRSRRRRIIRRVVPARVRQAVTRLGRR